MRRIVCAALRSKNGSILVGIRHYSTDMQEQIESRADGLDFYYRSGDNQGFVDKNGVYLTRREAYEVAKAAGQIVRPEACRVNSDGTKFLHSEGLY